MGNNIYHYYTLVTQFLKKQPGLIGTHTSKSNGWYNNVLEYNEYNKCGQYRGNIVCLNISSSQLNIP